MLIFGYDMRQREVGNNYNSILNGFNEFVDDYCGRNAPSAGWAMNIYHYVKGDEEKGLDMFYELLDEFLKTKEATQKKHKKTDSLYLLLQKIREKPAIYLGENSLEKLHHFMNGYIICEVDLGLNNKQDDIFWREFQEYIQKSFNINSSQHWTRIISFFSSNEQEAFYKFFELLDEFLKEKEMNQENV